MTVAELIEQLQQHPKDMRVIVCGYEGGYHDAKAAESIPILLNINQAWYYGPHEEWDSSCKAEKPDEIAMRIA